MAGVEKALQTYAKFNTYGGILIILIFIICVGFLEYDSIKKKYVKSKNAFISYNKLLDDNKIENCGLVDLTCEYYINYETENGNMIRIKLIKNIDPKKYPTVGPVSVYYSSVDPNSYTQSPISPTLMYLICLIILFVLLGFLLMRLKLIKSNSTFGAIDGATSLIRIF